MTTPFTCPSCGAVIAASDWETLAWGVRTHECPRPANPFARQAKRDGRSALEAEVVRFLDRFYGRPFFWFAAGAEKVLRVG